MIRLEQPWPEVPELAAVYDVECAGRWDHDFYLGIADDIDAGTVVDVGCGTGVFNVDVARQGRRSIGTDPAAVILDIARARDGGELCEWVHGGPGDLEASIADLVIMMGHVAQYFLTDDDWAEVLAGCRHVLRPGGYISFENRMPWIDWRSRWTRERSEGELDHPDGGRFTSWVEMVDWRELDHGPLGRGGLDTHEGHTVLPDGRHFVSSESLRFRTAAEVRGSLDAAGFDVVTEWGWWDRAPFVEGESEELIVLARRR